MQKNKADVYGYKENCLNFKQCPLCYGCRNYNSSSIKCLIKCGGTNKKFNTCRIEKHKSELLNNFIKPEIIKIKT